jgi:hypothetical protein
MFKLANKFRVVATSAVLALSGGAVSNANAAAVFTINPNVLGLTSSGSNFSADFVSGNSTALIAFTGTSGGVYNYSSTGYITYTGFSLASSPIGAGTTRLTVDYGLYATFSQTFTCGSALGVGVQCGVNTINLSLFADPGFLDKFVQASTPFNAPTVTDVGSNDILLGTADFVTSGLAGINALGGAYENVNTNFNLTPNGSLYFDGPVPFYNLAFSEFNNTSIGAGDNNLPDSIAITGESGGTQFSVPEPATLALLGLGLVGLGISRRKV